MRLWYHGPMKAATGQRIVSHILRVAHAFPALRRRAGVEAQDREWSVELALVSAPAMRKLNAFYRKKDYATDVLSFPSPAPFRVQGMLGELVICLPVLKKQARAEGHAMQRELEILIVHGVLHLLGFDHELGAKHAVAQARWEEKILGRAGLIARASVRGKGGGGKNPARRSARGKG